MPTATPFTSRISIPDLIAPGQSIGAHLAAKLDCFSTDERTLTDELCDMLCIWLSHKGSVVSAGASAPFNLSLTKTTAAEEVKNGADLELVVASPAGIKRCLIEAKVLDPASLKLRCDSTAGWKKLRSQLVAARAKAGNLAFLLVYVPGRLLDQQQFGFSTYEQGFLTCAPSSKESYFGATIIPVSDLISPVGRWRSTKHKVKHDGKGSFTGGIPFWRFLMELMLCRRGHWSDRPEPKADAVLPPFRRFVMTVSGIERAQWSVIEASADQWLGNSDRRGE